MRWFLLLSLAFLSTACTPVRFAIDVLPATDSLDETVVMEDDGASSRSKIAMIDVTGLIIDSPAPGLLAEGDNPVSSFVEALERARDDDDVKAVVLRLNSPGGTVTASDVMYREVVHFREETGKPVVMLMSDVAASGAYYLACAGDTVIAHETTITGSIGVIMQLVNFSEGMDKIGISADAVTSGPNKSMGSPFEPEEAEHRALFQEMVDEFYARFRTVVLTERQLSPADIDWVTDGRIVSGARAAEIGLVDRTGSLRDAFEEAKALAGMEEAQLVKYHRAYSYVGSAYATAPAGNVGPATTQTQINMIQLNLPSLNELVQPGFWYLWDPNVQW
jgi:protease-4